MNKFKNVLGTGLIISSMASYWDGDLGFDYCPDCGARMDGKEKKNG